MAVTFVTPHQGVNSGGVYTIERFALECARWMPVTLVVEKGERRELPGIRVLGASAFDKAEAPDADWIVVPADSQALDRVLELPRSKGTVVLFLQGYGTPGNPVVEQNLGRVRRVLAGAGWLVDVARAAGCSVELVRYGLDRSIFFPPAEERDRGHSVALMASPLQWKGTADALAALRLVRAQLPDTSVRIFGRDDPRVPGAQFLAAPPATREEIADLMRSCAVFVSASWEEGFGLPGIEAIACGCTLVTTDTKGSREYAIDRETALVSPPHEPENLAANALQALENSDLRARLVEQGTRLVDERYRPWCQSGEAFLAALTRLRSSPVLSARRSPSNRSPGPAP